MSRQCMIIGEVGQAHDGSLGLAHAECVPARVHLKTLCIVLKASSDVGPIEHG